MGKCLWVYKRTVELNNQTGFIEVPSELVDAAVAKDCAQDPKGVSSYALKRRDLFTKPVSLQEKKTRKKKSVDADSLQEGAPVEMNSESMFDEPKVED